MASALARGIGEPVYACDLVTGKAEALVEAVGGEVLETPAYVADAADAIVLAHKPGQLAEVADRFKDSIPVVLNLQGAEHDLSKRMIDFASGLTYALDGGMQRIADKVFMLTPRNVEISAEERAQLIEKGFFNQS